MRDNILKTITHEYPEIKAKLHLPMLCQVVAAKPEIQGASTRETPRHCVTAQLLNEDLAVSTQMPLLEDVPVAIPFAGQDRGLSALPQPGAICEICFAYGKLTLPFIRSVLPLNLKLPCVELNSIKIQFSSESSVSIAEKEIRQKSEDILLFAKKIHIGTDQHNFLKLVSEFMQSTATALASLAAHTHPYINVGAPAVTSPNQQGSAVTAEQSTINTLKGALDDFTK